MDGLNSLGGGRRQITEDNAEDQTDASVDACYMGDLRFMIEDLGLKIWD